MPSACTLRVATGCDLETPYDEAVQHWTAAAELRDNVDERASFTATVESKIFREQRVREQARQLGWSPEAAQTESQAQAKAADAETAFVVGAYTDRVRDNNLADKTSLWRVALETPAGELTPTKVEALGRPDENLRKLYPYLDVFMRVYRVHFTPVATGPVTLRISSGVGKADLTFERL
jgi:hypothetical protein